MIIFDTETTGLVQASATPLEKQPRIIDFAAIKLDDDFNEIGSIEFLCNPGIPLDKKITEITKLTDEDLKDQKPFIAYYNELAEFFLGERTLIAHNLSFDRDLLKFELLRIGKQYQFPWPIENICTVEKTMSLRNYRLSLAKLHAAAGFGEIVSAHRAMPDVKALVKCVKWLVDTGTLKIGA